MTTWPPTYTIRESTPAKHMSLRIAAGRGLEVVLPNNMNAKRVPAFIEKHKHWIIKHLSQLDGPIIKSEYAELLPKQLNFSACDEQWQIEYLPMSKRLQIFLSMHQRLVLCGKQDAHRAQKLLKNWVQTYATDILRKWLSEISQEIALPFKEVSIRGQKQRWGSCSDEKKISLNYKLIFMPKDFVRYVMIHELCHTQHLNHSPAFWQLVQLFSPNFQSLKLIAKQWTKYIPFWLEVL